MTKHFAGIFVVLAALGTAGVAEAQFGPRRSPLSLEIRGHLAFPTGDLADEFQSGGDLETGGGVAGDVTFQLTPLLGLYGGGSWTQYGVEDFEEANYEDYGFEAGAKLTLPIAGALSPFLRGGAVFHQVRLNVDDDLGDDLDFEDEEIGFEVGGGINIPLGPTLSLVPSVRYVQFGLGNDFNWSYVAAGLGLAARL